MARKNRDPEGEAVQRSRRKLEDALEETRWGLEKEFGWKLGAKSAGLLIVAIAAGFAIGQFTKIQGRKRIREANDLEREDRRE